MPAPRSGAKLLPSEATIFGDFRVLGGASLTARSSHPTHGSREEGAGRRGEERVERNRLLFEQPSLRQHRRRGRAESRPRPTPPWSTQSRSLLSGHVPGPIRAHELAPLQPAADGRPPPTRARRPRPHRRAVCIRQDLAGQLAALAHQQLVEEEVHQAACDRGSGWSCSRCWPPCHEASRRSCPSPPEVVKASSATPST